MSLNLGEGKPTDSAAAVVVCVDGVCPCVQTETKTVLRQALTERIRPVLALRLPREEAYQTIENANVVATTYVDPLQLLPEKGTVAFSAGLRGWAFTLDDFARKYASKFGVYEGFGARTTSIPSCSAAIPCENLYEGPLDDVYANTIRNCDPEGPLMFYVSKMIPTAYTGEFFALGRASPEGPNYISRQKEDMYVKSIQRTVIWMGWKQESIDVLPCGNMVAMLELDQCMANNATLTVEAETDSHPIRAMKFSASPRSFASRECKSAATVTARPRME
ncbi:hypothetical protein ACLOJK_010548 [Asimina triloba]